MRTLSDRWANRTMFHCQHAVTRRRPAASGLCMEVRCRCCHKLLAVESHQYRRTVRRLIDIEVR